MKTTVAELLQAARDLRRAVDALSFGPPVAVVYDPLDYAWAAYKTYIERFAHAPCDVLLVGMNPGPFGMAQTGVPFGEVTLVSSWMKIRARIKKPELEHPARPVDGFDTRRSEVSGARLWGAVAARYPKPEDFFARHLVLNYCPLLFLEEGGRNLTPVKLPKAERAPLEAACDAHLQRALQALRPAWVLGVGGYAEKRVRAVAPAAAPEAHIGCLPHPSPASPRANAGWTALARQALVELGIEPFL